MADKTPEIGAKFFIGVALLVFLVVMHTFFKDIPAHLFILPAFIMGFSPTEIVKIIMRK